MSLDRQQQTSFQTLRRIVLSVLTVFILLKLIFSLIATIDRPQIQGKFELYQTNLVLEAAQWQPSATDSLGALKTALVGADVLKSASEQYQSARTTDAETIAKLDRQLSQPTATSDDKSLKQTIAAARLEIDKIDLRLGIIQATQNLPTKAIKTWQQVRGHAQQAKIEHLAGSLIDIWQSAPTITDRDLPQLTTEIETNFDGWFRDRVLSRLYTDLSDSSALVRLEATEQARAKNAFSKLAINIIPRVILGLFGVGLIVFYIIKLIIQILSKQSDKSIFDLLFKKLEPAWTTPWNWEIVWQVFTIGFFFVGQFLLPFIFSLFINPAKLTVQGQGLYVFGSYVLMASLGLGVLYISIKNYLPLPADWFNFKWRSNWWLWGIGGYLVATPIVVIVSVLNERIWQGEGGSNPILQIVLEGRDPIALVLFFLTAAVAAPLFEEFLFRGFLLPSLTRYVPVWAAIGLSSLLFGVAHLSLSEIIPLTTLGIVLGVVYTRTRNLLAPMLLHSIWNSSTLVSLYILGSSN